MSSHHLARDAAAAEADAIAARLPRVDIGLVSGEAQCLALGDVLGRAHTDFGQLTGSFNRMEASFAGPEIQRLSAAIEAVRATVSGLGGGLDAECRQVEALMELNRSVAARLDLVRRAVQTITALATNSRVEAANIDAQGGEISSFALELAGLAARCHKAIDNCRREQTGLTEGLKASHGTLVSFKRQQSVHLADVERDLGDVAGALREHQARLGETASALASRGKDIVASIGTIVMSLQIGDSTRQRIEHATETLAEVPALYPDPAASAAATVVAGRLAAAQLEGAAQDFGAAFTDIRHAMEDLSRQAGDIVRMAQQIDGDDRAQSQSFVGSIRARMAAALGLSQRAAAARAEVDRSIDEIVRSTSSLEAQIGTLSEVTTAMTMTGINAVLKAKRVGTAGLGLGVIADQLRDCAGSVVHDVGIITPVLDEIVLGMRTLAEMLAGRRDELGDGGMAGAHAALDAFTTIGAEMDRSLEALVRDGSRIAHDLAAAAARRSSRDGSEAMRQFVDRLDQVLADIPQGTGSADDLETIEAAFGRRYTMAAERDIHAAFWTAGESGRAAA